MRDTVRGEDHAVAAARLDGEWLMLDNRRMAMVADANTRNYRPLFVINQDGAMRYADALLLASLPDRTTVTPVALNAVAQPGLVSPAD